MNEVAVPRVRRARETDADEIVTMVLAGHETTATALAWAVFAPTSGLHHGALRGNYVGASGDASFGVGAGAKVLVGGSHRTISLQPLSVQGQVGVNLALGVAGLRLR